MSKSLLDRGIIAVENIDSKGDRWAAFTANGSLKISEFSKVTEGQEVILQNWDEIERLRNFLNSLKPVKKPEEVVIHAATA